VGRSTQVTPASARPQMRAGHGGPLRAAGHKVAVQRGGGVGEPSPQQGSCALPARPAAAAHDVAVRRARSHVQVGRCRSRSLPHDGDHRPVQRRSWSSGASPRPSTAPCHAGEPEPEPQRPTLFSVRWRASVVTDLWAAPRIVVSGSDLASIGPSRQPQRLSSPSRCVTTCHAASSGRIWDGTRSCTVEGLRAQVRKKWSGAESNCRHRDFQTRRIPRLGRDRANPGIFDPLIVSRGVTSCHGSEKAGWLLRRADGRQALRSFRLTPASVIVLERPRLGPTTRAPARKCPGCMCEPNAPSRTRTYVRRMTRHRGGARARQADVCEVAELEDHGMAWPRAQRSVVPPCVTGPVRLTVRSRATASDARRERDPSRVQFGPTAPFSGVRTDRVLRRGRAGHHEAIIARSLWPFGPRTACPTRTEVP
jgi:hypothetical protein